MVSFCSVSAPLGLILVKRGLLGNGNNVETRSLGVSNGNSLRVATAGCRNVTDFNRDKNGLAVRSSISVGTVDNYTVTIDKDIHVRGDTAIGTEYLRNNVSYCSLAVSSTARIGLRSAKRKYGTVCTRKSGSNAITKATGVGGSGLILGSSCPTFCTGSKVRVDNNGIRTTSASSINVFAEKRLDVASTNVSTDNCCCNVNSGNTVGVANNGLGTINRGGNMCVQGDLALGGIRISTRYRG